jgi:hypothetical protein
MTHEKSRIEDTRALETRDANIRKHLRMEYQDALYIAPEDIPPDVKYRWIMESVLGRPDASRLANMKRKGWEPVPISRHPDRMSEQNSHHVPSHLKGYIYHNGLVLCERLKIYCDVEEENVNKETLRVMTATPGTDHLMNDPTMPMKVFFNENSIIKSERKGSFADD